MRRFATFVLSAIAFLSIFPLYSRYKTAAAPIPPGVHLAGVEMSRYKDPAAIQAALDQLYLQPVAVYFDDRRLVLLPEEIDFQVDAPAMIQEASRFLEGPYFLDIALRHFLGLPQRRRDVPLRYRFDPAKLGAWLQQVAQEYDHGPILARVLPPTWQWDDETSPFIAMPATFVGNAQQDWQWSPGRPGQRLNLEQSAPRILEAFTRMDDRVARLALDETPAPPVTMEALGQALDSYLSDFPGFGAVYVQDLTTGQEATVDVDVAFSGMSTLKVAIVTAVFQQRLEGMDNPEVGQWMDQALGESNNFAANLLVRYLGYTDIFAGARRVTEFMRQLGFVNTYMQAGYDDKRIRAEIPTPANQRTDWNTNPDTHLQSTPADMGRLLAAIYRCYQGEGPLLETFPGELTPEECGYVLFYMSHDEFEELIWAGLPRPNQTWIVHKHGFVNEAHSDLALVWGPAGPYVIAVYLWRPGWMDWNTSNSTMKAISRIVWNFFQFKAAQEGIQPDPPPVLLPPPGYIPVGEYHSVAATAWEKAQETSSEPASESASTH